MKKGEEIFSRDELATLKNFVNQAAKEDKRIHGIQANNNNNNKQNQYIQKKEEKKPQQPKIQPKPIKNPEQPKPIVGKPPHIKKEEKPINKIEPKKPQVKLENKMEIPKTSPAPRVEYINAVFPEPPKTKYEKPKEEIKKIPQNATFQKAEIIKENQKPPEPPKKKYEKPKEEIKKTPRGGSYGFLRKFTAGKKKYEIHHMPAASSSPLTRWKGPCIIMSKKDHKNTSSYGE